MARYLLPCSCGQQLEVDSTQAGLQVQCRCGKSLEVPTLRGLKQLTPATSQQAPVVSSTWGPRQGVTFLGIVVFLCGLIGVLVLFATRPAYETPQWKDFDENARRTAQQMTLQESFDTWNSLQKEPFNHNLSPALRSYEERTAAYTRWMVASAVVALLGGVMAGAALAAGKRPTRKA